MADCVSNAAELVKQLRSNQNNVWMWQAADAIEALMQENAKLKAERDAAVAEIPKHCGTCKRFSSGEACLNDANGCGWEWRGVQKEGEDG